MLCQAHMRTKLLDRKISGTSSKVAEAYRTTSRQNLVTMVLPCQQQRTVPTASLPASGSHNLPCIGRRSAAPSVVQCQAASKGSGPATRVQASNAAVAERPPTQASSQEDDLYDCVVVGGGISGLTTAQACITEHADTFKRCTHPQELLWCFQSQSMLLQTINAARCLHKHEQPEHRMYPWVQKSCSADYF